MLRRYENSGGKPFKIMLGLTTLLLLFGVGIAVVSVQNQTSTRSEARRLKAIKRAPQGNPLAFINPKVSLVQGSKPCKVYYGTDIQNLSNKKVSFTYNVELRTTSGDMVVNVNRTATVGPKQTRNIGATLSSAGLKANGQYNPKITLLKIPDTADRPNSRTVQTIRMPSSC